MLRLMLTTVLSAAVAGCAALPHAPGAALPVDDPMSAAVRDMCTSDVALLGEGANHGDGRSLAFKAALVRRLVEQCHFDAIVFEGSSYDFDTVAPFRSMSTPDGLPKLASAAATGLNARFPGGAAPRLKPFDRRLS